MPPARGRTAPAGIILVNHARDVCKPSLVNPGQDPTAERLWGHALKPESHFPPLCLPRLWVGRVTPPTAPSRKYLIPTALKSRNRCWQPAGTSLA